MKEKSPACSRDFTRSDSGSDTVVPEEALVLEWLKRTALRANERDASRGKCLTLECRKSLLGFRMHAGRENPCML